MGRKHADSGTLYNVKYKTVKRKRKNNYNPEEEARLEKDVFGDTSDIIKNLLNEESVPKPDNDESTDTHHKKQKTSKNVQLSDHDDSTSKSDTEDTNLKEKEAAWEDDDDCNYTVNTALDAQNRTLPCKRPEKLYATYLKNHYKIFVGTPKWATIEESKNVDDNDSVLKKCRFTVKSKSTHLPKDIIDIKALKALNKDTHTEGPVVTSVEFHSDSALSLVAGTSGVLSFFQVDGHTNNKVYSILHEKNPISKATFMNGMEVLIGSQYSSNFHTFDLMNKKTYKAPLPHGITNMKIFEVSPNRKFIAICGRKGEFFLLDGSTKELISRLNMNAYCKTLAFTPDNKNLITHGDGGEMYIWDLNSRTCLHRAIDDGCLSGTALAVSSSGQFVATGSAQGVVNLYETKTLLEKKCPTPVKVMMNLVTSITSLKFNPNCEILAAASNLKRNAFRMMHLPSFHVFSNFPGFQTNIGNPQSLDFSPESGYLSITNKTGSALLYRLRHYGNY